MTPSRQVLVLEICCANDPTIPTMFCIGNEMCCSNDTIPQHFALECVVQMTPSQQRLEFELCCSDDAIPTTFRIGNMFSLYSSESWISLYSSESWNTDKYSKWRQIGPCLLQISNTYPGPTASFSVLKVQWKLRSKRHGIRTTNTDNGAALVMCFMDASDWIFLSFFWGINSTVRRLDSSGPTECAPLSIWYVCVNTCIYIWLNI